MQDREVMFFLQFVQGIGKKTIHNLWEYFGTGQAIFDAGEKDLEKILKPVQLRAFLNAREKKRPEEEIVRLQKKGIDYYSVFDEGYPKRLLKVLDRPNGLFVRGSLPDEDSMTISIVGTRRHSYYGEKKTKQFSRLIVENGIPIISGMARGIDGIAQKTAVEYGGKTYAVLGCGVDVCYPPEHKQLFEQIPMTGGIISEYPPGTEPAAGLFPMRNRIISGLGDILLVMEAREKSGTLITVDMALEQGKEIWALPGRVDDVLSVGCNRLIAQGAAILPGITEFEKELEILCEKYGKKVESFGMKGEEGTVSEGKKGDAMHTAGERDTKWNCLSLIEKAVAAALDYQPLSLSNIYERLDMESKTRYSIRQVSIALMELCMKNMAKQEGGGYFIRC